MNLIMRIRLWGATQGRGFMNPASTIYAYHLPLHLNNDSLQEVEGAMRSKLEQQQSVITDA